MFRKKLLEYVTKNFKYLEDWQQIELVKEINEMYKESNHHIKWRIRNWIKKRFNLYDISDLRIGGSCGICGSYMDNEIFPKGYKFSTCEECKTMNRGVK